MISIIIPTYNEEESIENTLIHIRNQGNDCEIIIVDDGSSDKTVDIASRYCKVIYSGKKSRGKSLDKGVKESSGDILLFVHADTILPDNALKMIRETLKDREVVAGGFRRRLNNEKFIYRIIETGSDFIRYLKGLIGGDQAIFCRRDAFFSAGGFKGRDLFEDIDLCRRLKKHGKMKIIKSPVLTSARHYEKYGILKCVYLNLYLTFLYYRGAAEEKLRDMYYKE